MSDFVCTCVPAGQPIPHSDPSQCAKSMETTGVYLARINDAAFAGTARQLAAGPCSHLVANRACAWCPVNSMYVRDSVDGPWYIPFYVRMAHAFYVAGQR